MAWNIIYDPTKDEILTWNNTRIHIYRRRSRRQFVYLQRKHENTFPRTAKPIRGHWQGSYFIVEHIDHWTNTPTALPAHHSIPQWPYTRTMTEMEINWHHHQTSSDTHTHSDKHTGNTKHTTALIYYTWKMITAPHTMTTKHTEKPQGTQNRQPTKWIRLLWHQHQATPTMATPQDSHMSNKWHPLARIKIRWNQRRLDAYLALVEVICEWNTEPG
jgi:hypothetical protein